MEIAVVWPPRMPRHHASRSETGESFSYVDGRTKILDFGLAKSSEAPLPDDATQA